MAEIRVHGQVNGIESDHGPSSMVPQRDLSWPKQNMCNRGPNLSFERQPNHASQLKGPQVQGCGQGKSF